MGPNQQPKKWHFIPIICKIDGERVDGTVHKDHTPNFEEAVEYYKTQLNDDWKIDYKTLEARERDYYLSAMLNEREFDGC